VIVCDSGCLCVPLGDCICLFVFECDSGCLSADVYIIRGSKPVWGFCLFLSKYKKIQLC
jgi:hypothetical protein